ncbi:S-adenosyl-L-methionine-dependent methyltransferase [Endogone sp. FLAS-F59071]|nr:S-adenosyl-L-methionine-dependent methyltransferase [Endogone sp. FLAS-F59071]|eukprot:RUS19988.1 S-adenosyl-L-methionine-dependent methyltransferase [Endogone sp. FLAS-F59071]
MGQRLTKLSKRRGHSHPELRPAIIPIPLPLPGPSPLPNLSIDLSSGFKRQRACGPKEAESIEDTLECSTPGAVRLNMQHRSVRNYFAPVHNELVSGIKVLDACCATGIWAFKPDTPFHYYLIAMTLLSPRKEMAKAYPNSEFIGTDIVEDFKQAALIAPSNCRFEFGDIIKGLPYEDNSFDFVFQRFMTGCFTDEEWLVAIKELIRVTKPGGWVELSKLKREVKNVRGEVIYKIFFKMIHRLYGFTPPHPTNKVDNQGWAVNAGPRTQEFFQTIYVMMSKRGIDVRWSSNFRTVLKNQGLEDVIYDYFSVPSGWGPEEIVEFSGKNFMAGFLAFRKSMQSSLGLTDTEYDEMIVEAMQELRPFQTFWNADFTYGRKPLARGNSVGEILGL